MYGLKPLNSLFPALMEFRILLAISCANIFSYSSTSLLDMQRCKTIAISMANVSYGLHSLIPRVQTFTAKISNTASRKTIQSHDPHISYIRRNFSLRCLFLQRTLWSKLLRGCFSEHYNRNISKSEINRY